MNFAELAEFKPRIEATIERQFADARRTARPEFRPYLDLLREFTLRGGKRFRALLVLAGYHLASRRPPTPALAAAAALEHFQSWMLVHDDIIDHSATRRGGPTVHRILAERHAAAGRSGPSDDFGVGLGITLGDLEEPFTVGALLACPVPAPRRLAALAEYVRMTRETAFGQALDIENGTRPVAEVRESDVLQVHELKSAFYTVASPLRIGARLGGGGDRLADDLEGFGRDIGVAFQLRDDVLGAGLGDAPTEKSANDLTEGKRTLLVLRAWAGADAAGRELLGRVLGRPESSDDDRAAVQGLIRSTGSLAYSESRIEALRRRALARVTRSRALREPGKALLREIADRLVFRSV